MRLVLSVILLASVLGAEDSILTKPASSSRAKSLRTKAYKAWAPVQPLWERIQNQEKLDPPTLQKISLAVEDAIYLMERSLRVEWDQESNTELADMVEAWFRIREMLPPSKPPQDPEALKKWQRELAKKKRKLLTAARKFVTSYGSARRYESQYDLCRKCDGRKYLRDPFGGEARPCTLCRRRGRLADTEAILEARWYVYSPFYRKAPRNTSKVERVLRVATRTPDRAGPFITKLSIKGTIEDHDLWVRVRTKEKRFKKLENRKHPESIKHTYTLFRAGRVWYLYSPRFDGKMLEVPAEETESN
ncbi:MAG: hypothetical protein O7E54_00095 [Planctomycetota bacterium]|nr:hypothetical protein [Planctomycetota bacterium]